MREFHDLRQVDAADHFTSQQGAAVTEVTIKNADGVVARTDIVIKGDANGTLDIPPGFTATDIYGKPVTNIPLDGNGRAMVEIKTGNAHLTENQKTCYGDACTFGGVEGRGGSAEQIGIQGQDAPRSVVILRDITKGS